MICGLNIYVKKTIVNCAVIFLIANCTYKYKYVKKTITNVLLLKLI